jgi:hypothetical protein
MTTLTGASTRTITGYIVTLLEYPRWLIEREVDFSHCRLGGSFDAQDEECRDCHFGEACSWLNTNRSNPTTESPIPDLLQALQTAVTYIRDDARSVPKHDRHCDCDKCAWLHEATNFLRTQRHKT